MSVSETENNVEFPGVKDLEKKVLNLLKNPLNKDVLDPLQKDINSSGELIVNAGDKLIDIGKDLKQIAEVLETNSKKLEDVGQGLKSAGKPLKKLKIHLD